MNPTLSQRMIDFLRVLEEGERRPKALVSTQSALWSRGLIDQVLDEWGEWVGWKLTAEGKLALKAGRQMLSSREP